jgi:hypothetical protein
MDLAARRAKYSKVSTALAHLDDVALGVLLGGRHTASSWGATQLVEVAGERVFVKLVPLTERELARSFSTRNHYQLPLYYQYGVNSAGFGAWREAVAHLETTNWVLEGATAAFPLAYHARVLRRPSRSRLVPSISSERLGEYVRYWNSSKNIGRFVMDRADGSHAVAVFLEQLPRNLAEWLAERPSDTERLYTQLCEAITFLRGRGVVHFDAHFENIMTDGSQVYVSDFGLVVDPRFDLAAKEREFLDRHSHYDYGAALCSIGPQLLRWYAALPEASQQSVRDRLGDGDTHIRLVTEVERLAGLVDPSLMAATVRFRDVIMFMYDFYTSLQANRRKNTPFDDAGLGDLLRSAGVLSG